VYDADTGAPIADLARDGDVALLVRGGKGAWETSTSSRA